MTSVSLKIIVEIGYKKGKIWEIFLCHKFTDESKLLTMVSCRSWKDTKLQKKKDMVVYYLIPMTHHIS